MTPERAHPSRDVRRPVPPADPLTRFLGPGASRNGPFGVLGLPVRRVSEGEVLAALHAAMARIDEHPEARTPGADEARLAVHAAAANLLDRAVLVELLRRLGKPGAADAPATGGGVPAGDPQRVVSPEPVSSVMYDLEADLLRSIAAEGGWSRSAMDRFLRLAHGKGRTPAEAVAAIGQMARHEFSPPPASALPAPEPRRADVEENDIEPEEAVEAEPGPIISVLVAVVLIGAALLIVSIAGWLAVRGVNGPDSLADRGPASPPPAAESVDESDQPAQPAPDEPGPPVAARALDNAPAILHEFEVAVEGLAIDVEGSLEAFEQAVAAVSDRWVGFSPPDLVASQDLVIGYVYHVSGDPGAVSRALGAIESGAATMGVSGEPEPAEIRRMAWSMGTLARLRREQNLPSTIIRRIDGVLLRAPEGLAPNASTFRAGAVAALRASAERLAEMTPGRAKEERWASWSAAVRAAAGGDEALAESVVLGAIEAVLSRAEGGEDARTLGVLVAELSWRAGGAARAWLLRAFADRSMTTADLHALTLALATRSAAEGVDHSMVLSRGASEYERRELEERYRVLWGVEAGADQSEAVASFVGKASAVLAQGPGPEGRDEVAVLAQVTRLARLNAAAALLWRAETAAATDLLGDLDGPIDAVVESEDTSSAGPLFRSGSGTWAESYLGAESHIPRRLELLETLRRRLDTLEPMEAEVLVTEAVRGSPQRVRDAAAALVEAGSSQPVMVNAVLEALPMMPRTDRNAKIVELAAGVSLPGVGATEWAHEARRALVERLLELIAGRGMYAKLDALAGLLNEAYTMRLRGPSASGGADGGDAGRTVRLLADRWADDAEARPPAGVVDLGIDDIQRRRAARLAMASGLVQGFHVDQLELMELMAHAVASEQPDMRRAVRTLLDDLDAARRRSRSVLVQLELTERAMLRLWSMRFGGGAA